MQLKIWICQVMKVVLNFEKALVYRINSILPSSQAGS